MSEKEKPWKGLLAQKVFGFQALDDLNTHLYFIRAYISTTKSTTHACYPSTSDVFPMPLLPVETTTPPLQTPTFPDLPSKVHAVFMCRTWVSRDATTMQILFRTFK
jgi:hypothetical protein